ncbi:HNH endonuclease signature motif containing protein [Bosea eneae]|uniref:HNH endonuclease signature motif containing protein n=1 Tax=Bosea eneae TaxID=151454 RepID=A0ABW0J150_9HYPH
MTVTRRKLTTVDKLKVVVAQATCPLCRGKLGDLADLDFDHEHALALGGADEIENLRAVHRDCHAVKTRGAGATTAGSDIGKIAKMRRNAKKEAAFRAQLLAKATGSEPPAPTRRKSRIPSRPFPNRKRSKA